MDAAPPNYEEIVDKDHWHLVAKYVTIDDLLSMVLVCKEWHQKLSPQLWGSPLSHWPEQPERARSAVTRFMGILPDVRTSLRELTHTLIFPKLATTFNEWQREDWLPDMLDQLYRLQALVVRGAPIFDHASLLALKQHGTADWITGQWHSSGLRLLDASNCENATSAGISLALEHLPMLVYVDLSHTPAAKKYTVLEKFRLLQYLRVLKLRDIGLTDDNLFVLAKAIGVKVRSLDLASNRLTDASIDILRDHCQLPAAEFLSIQRDTSNECTTAHDASVKRSVQGPDFEHLLHTTLTSSFIDELSFDDGTDIGLTHLRIASNTLTNSIPKLFEYPSFHVLDIGSDDPTTRLTSLDFSTFEALLARLTYLRIHHSAIQLDTPTPTTSPSPAFIFPPEQMYDIPQLIARRQNLSARHQNETPHNLLPNLPGLQTLVLTGIPRHTKKDAKVASGIVAFIRSCALHAALARRQAELDYALPPGTSAEAYAKELFPLDVVVLELAAVIGGRYTTTTAGSSTAKKKRSCGLSTTDDEDGDAFLAASAGDFSFFDKGDDTSTTSSDKVKDEEEAGGQEMHDVIAEVAAFRKEAKRKYDEAPSLGQQASFVKSGFWPGTVRVVRN